MDGSQVTDQMLRQGNPSLHVPDPVAESALTVARDAPVIQPVTRVEPQEPAQRSALPDDAYSASRRGSTLRWLLACVKRLATLAIALIAVVMALVTWDYYVTAPWTRDGRVRVQVASVAPQVSGQITELLIGDNQYVHKGDALYVIDPFDFEVASHVAMAQVQQRAADLQVKEVQSERRQTTFGSCDHPRATTGLCRLRGPGQSRLRSCAATGGAGGNQSAPNPGSQPGQRLCNEPPDARRRLRS